MRGQHVWAAAGSSNRGHFFPQEVRGLWGSEPPALTLAQEPRGPPARRPILTVPERPNCAQHSEATPTQRGPKMGAIVGWGP